MNTLFRSAIVATAAVMLTATVALAQGARTSETPNRQSQGSSNDHGVQIQGNTNMNVTAGDVNTIAQGKGNKAGASVGSIHGGTQIQGNTTMNVNAHNVNTVAAGKGNTACSQVGSIGDNPACKK
jgi:hypothetical protein